MSDKIQLTIKEMVLFRLLQQGENSLIRAVSKTRKGPGVA